MSNLLKRKDRDYVDIDDCDQNRSTTTFTVNPRFIADIKKMMPEERDIALIIDILFFFSENCIAGDKDRDWCYSMNASGTSCCVHQLWIKKLGRVPDMDIISKMRRTFETRMIDIIIVLPDISKNRMDVALCLHISGNIKKTKPLASCTFTRWRRNFFGEKMKEMINLNSGMGLSENIQAHIRVLTFISDVINNKDEYMKNIETQLEIDIDKKVYEIKFIGIDEISMNTLNIIESFRGQSEDDIATIKFKASREHISFVIVDQGKTMSEMILFVSYT